MFKLPKICYGTGDGFGGGGFGTNDSNASDVGGQGVAGGDYGSDSAHGDNDGYSGGYVDGWASEVFDAVNKQVNTSVDITGNDDDGYTFSGYDINGDLTTSNSLTFGANGAYTINRTTGWFDMELDSIEARNAQGQTLSGGSFASALNAYGLSAFDAITAEAVTSAAISIALGAPIGAISPTAKALQAQGLINEKISKSIQAAGAVVSFGMGMINSVQAFQQINALKSYGAINDFEAALMTGVNLGFMYGSFKSFQNNMNSLGFTATSSDLADFGMTSDGDSSYVNGTTVTYENLTSYISSFALYLARKNNADDVKKELFERMAGSLFYNNLAAGGDLFNPSISLLTNHIASIGKDIQYPMYAQMSYLQNDFVSVSINPYNMVSDYET